MSDVKLKEGMIPLILYNQCSIIRIGTQRDGNCFFHSILRSFNKSYINAKSWKDRYIMVKTLRNAAADVLDEKDSTGVSYYNSLSLGSLEEFSKAYPNASREYMQKELRSDRSVDNIYHELISNTLNLDIYFIDTNTRDVYTTTSHVELLYKGRRSILVCITQTRKGKDLISQPDTIGHYDVGGLRVGDTIHTLFDPNDPLIKNIRQRLYSKVKISIPS